MRWKGAKWDPPDDETAYRVGRDRRLANALVVLVALEGQDIRGAPPPQRPVSRETETRPAEEEPIVGPSLTARDGRLSPRIQAVRVGQDITLVNEDAPVAAFFGGSTDALADGEFSIRTVLRLGQRRQVALSSPGLIRVDDKARGGADAYIVVIDQDVYVLTADDGSFRFDGLLPWRYRVDVWRENGTRLSREVILQPGTPRRIEIELH